VALAARAPVKSLGAPRRAGLVASNLAERLGVSRQAVAPSARPLRPLPLAFRIARLLERQIETC
jgi:DNA-binding XRE family transcriptional regulator